MPRGGKREGAGRKAQGITRKVSLTLSAEEWERIEASGEHTIAAYLQSLMNKVTPIKEEADGKAEKGYYNQSKVNYNKIALSLSRREAEEYWTIFARDEESAAPEIVDGARAIFLRVMFPNNAETASLEVKPNFVCPFTGKRFGSTKALIKAAVPHLVESVSGKQVGGNNS